MNIKFISRHSLTECQKQKALSVGLEIEECIDTQTFESAQEIIKKYQLKTGTITAGVFPAALIWDLQKHGIAVLMFSSKNRGERVDQVTDLNNLELNIFQGLLFEDRGDFNIDVGKAWGNFFLYK